MSHDIFVHINFMNLGPLPVLVVIPWRKAMVMPDTSMVIHCTCVRTRTCTMCRKSKHETAVQFYHVNSAHVKLCAVISWEIVSSAGRKHERNNHSEN